MFTTKADADIKLLASLPCAFFFCCWHGQKDFPFQLIYFLSPLLSPLLPQEDSSQGPWAASSAPLHHLEHTPCSKSHVMLEKFPLYNPLLQFLISKFHIWLADTPRQATYEDFIGALEEAAGTLTGVHWREVDKGLFADGRQGCKRVECGRVKGPRAIMGSCYHPGPEDGGYRTWRTIGGLEKGSVSGNTNKWASVRPKVMGEPPVDPQEARGSGAQTM